jgi:uncharacterized membrane protein
LLPPLKEYLAGLAAYGERQLMRTCNALPLRPAFVLAFVIAAIAAGAPTLTFKFTPVRVPGALTTAVGGVNDAGVIVGQYQIKPATARGFMLEGDKLTRIDHPRGSQTICTHINSSGVIAGNYLDSSNNTRGFLYQNGKFTEIPGPTGATSSAANGINDNGLVVGSYGDAKFIVHGFLRQG